MIGGSCLTLFGLARATGLLFTESLPPLYSQPGWCADPQVATLGWPSWRSDDCDEQRIFFSPILPYGLCSMIIFPAPCSTSCGSFYLQPTMFRKFLHRPLFNAVCSIPSPSRLPRLDALSKPSLHLRERHSAVSTSDPPSPLWKPANGNAAISSPQAPLQMVGTLPLSPAYSKKFRPGRDLFLLPPQA